MTIEIHEDQPLVEPAAPWIRHIRAPVTAWLDSGGIFIHPPQIGIFAVSSGLFRLPADLTSVDELMLTLYPQATGNYTLRYFLNAGACGELFNTHTLTQNVVHALTANTLACIDLVTLFPVFFAALTAGDNLQIRVQNNAGPGWLIVYGLDLRYS